MKPIITCLIILISLAGIAQPSTNKPPENSPFKEDSKTKTNKAYSEYNHAIAFEPTLIFRGYIAFNYLQKLNNYPIIYKIGIGKSYGEDYLGDESYILTDGLRYDEIRRFIDLGAYTIKLAQTGVGYIIAERDGLESVGIMLHYNYGRVNLPTDIFEYPINGVDKVKLRTSTFGASIFANGFSNNDFPLFFSGINFGGSINRRAINESTLVDGNNPHYSMSKKMISNSYLFLLLNLQFGLGW
jgi:hypothetical protein